MAPQRVRWANGRLEQQTWIFNVLYIVDKWNESCVPDPRCLSSADNSAEWLLDNFGFFSSFASMADFYRLNLNFSGVNVGLVRMNPPFKSQIQPLMHCKFFSLLVCHSWRFCPICLRIRRRSYCCCLFLLYLKRTSSLTACSNSCWSLQKTGGFQRSCPRWFGSPERYLLWKLRLQMF